MRPIVSDAAEELYEALGAQAAGDNEADGGSWALLKLCHAVTLPIQAVNDLAADVVDADGEVVRPGWQLLLDVDHVPLPYLGFLGQMVGVALAPGLDEESQRLRVRSALGWQRGTPAAIVAAARQWMTGERRVMLTERHMGSAYRIQASVYEAEAVDVDQLYRALRAAVPAGIILTLAVEIGWTIAQMEAGTVGDTIANLEAAYATVSDFERETP